ERHTASVVPYVQHIYPPDSHTQQNDALYSPYGNIDRNPPLPPTRIDSSPRPPPANPSPCPLPVRGEGDTPKGSGVQCATARVGQFSPAVTNHAPGRESACPADLHC